jgi:hypothetical protein
MKTDPLPLPAELAAAMLADEDRAELEPFFLRSLQQPGAMPSAIACAVTTVSGPASIRSGWSRAAAMAGPSVGSVS